MRPGFKPPEEDGRVDMDAGGDGPDTPAGKGEFGPGGYLPERAANRARKIILREPLGRGWIVASLLAALLVVAGGIAYLLVGTGPPGPPYQEAGALEDVDPRGAATVEVGRTPVLVVRGAGGVRTYEAPPGEVVWCRQSQRLESPDGRVWDLAGRLRGGEGRPLRPLPAEVVDGRLYVDVESPASRPGRSSAQELPHCV